MTGEASARTRWVVHLTISATDLNRARVFARTAARALATLFRQVDTGEVTVSTEDDQQVRHRVFCDRLLAGGGRCALPTEHSVPCASRRAAHLLRRNGFRPR